MKEIVLSGAGWIDHDSFYDAFFEAVGAPSWHGRNLDALNDSIGAGDINKVEVPYTIKITGINSMTTDARAFVDRFSTLIGDLKEEGVPVNLSLED